MKTVTTIKELRGLLWEAKKRGERVGFVPTMGFLHEGHLSLVRACREASDRCVVSIFVNPAQFGPNMDLDRYPRDLDRDQALLRDAGVDIVFAPSAAEIYPESFHTWVEVEHLTSTLDGPSRPGYFRGICTVVLKLFNIVQPDVAFFGQKDLQQAVVLRKMIEDLNLEIDLQIMPTIREDDGLAMSSRNALLSPTARVIAPTLFRALSCGRERFEMGERASEKIKETVKKTLSSFPEIEVDYISVVDAETMQYVERIERKACLALAVTLEGTRLIDNILLG